MGAYFFIGKRYIFIQCVDIGNSYNQEQRDAILKYLLNNNNIFNDDDERPDETQMDGFKSYKNIDADKFEYLVPFDNADTHTQYKLITFMVGPLKDKKLNKIYSKQDALYVDLKKHSSKRLLNMIKKCYRLVGEEYN
jgi:hypothetical protein